MDIKAYIASGIIEMYVSGLCSPEEEQELEMLRGQYPELDLAITEFEEQWEKNLLLHSSLPGDETDKKILASFGTPQGETKIVPLSKRGRWIKPLAAAAVILLIISAGINYYLFRQNSHLSAEAGKPIPQPASPTLPENDYRVLNTPTITPVAMYGVGIHSICRCTMFWDKKTGKLYIMIHHLPKAPLQRDYQLWAMVDGKPVSVGLVDAGILGRFIELSNTPVNATAFRITLEQAGGSTTPNNNELYLEGRI